MKQIIGVYDALSAKIADSFGFGWLHVGGYNVAGSRLGLPDVRFRGRSAAACCTTGYSRASRR